MEGWRRDKSPVVEGEWAAVICHAAVSWLSDELVLHSHANRYDQCYSRSGPDEVAGLSLMRTDHRI